MRNTNMALVSATSARRPRCWSASTPSASPGTSSVPCGATASAAPASSRCHRTEGVGVLLYLRQEGRGIGLVHKISLTAPGQGQAPSRPTRPSASRRPTRLRHRRSDSRGTGRRKIRLMTNNPRKFVGSRATALEDRRAGALEVPASDESRRYLQTKKEKLGHC